MARKDHKQLRKDPGYWSNTQYAWTYEDSQLRTILSCRRLTCPDKASSDELSALIQRNDNGLLHYENCTVDELIGFITARGIPHNSKDELTRLRCSQLLQQADQGPSLDMGRFKDLPEELRDMIYTHYCSGFAKEVLYAPASPPLARVHRDLRAGVLRAFHRTCLFLSLIHI